MLNLDNIFRLLLIDNLCSHGFLVCLEQNFRKDSRITIAPVLLNFIIVQIDEVLHRIDWVTDYTERS